MIVLGHDPKAKSRTVELSPASLLRHVAIIGSSGSGKTVTCKVLCEELALRGIPIIAVDPQGDIASLGLPGDPDEIAEQGGDAERARRFHDNVEVVVWTPVSSAGMPISVNPLTLKLEESQSEAERVRAISFVAQNITQLLGYDTGKRDGRSVMALLDLVLTYAVNTGWELDTLGKLADAMKDLPEALAERAEDLITKRMHQEVVRQLRTLTVGARKLLFSHGAPLDIDLLLGRDESEAPPEFVPQESDEESSEADSDGGGGERKRKTRISVIYLNTLTSQEEKAFFLAELSSALYHWMLSNPASEPQAAFYIDEIAPFLPPTKKPASRDILRLLFKQARKYGVTCVMATQNPGDVDYKSLAQFATVLLGRLTTKQDVEKITHLVQSLAPNGADAVLAALPRLKAGKFRVISPDNFQEPAPLKVRWLLTEHRTLDEDGLEEVVDAAMRKRLKRAGKALAERDRSRQQQSTRVLSKGFASEEQAAEDAVRHAVHAARHGTAYGDDVEDEIEFTASVDPPTEMLTAAEAASTVAEPAEPTEPRNGSSGKGSNAKEARITGERILGAAELGVAEQLADPSLAMTQQADVAHEHGLSERQLEVLALLREKPALLTQNEIADHFDYAKTTISKDVRALEDAGLVCRVREGKHHYFHAAEHRHTAYGFLASLTVAKLRISESRAHEVGNRAVPGTIFGRSGEVADTKLRYLPLWRMSFVGRRTNRLLGFIPWGDEKVDESVYMHPTQDRIAILTRSGLKFEQAPPTNPAEIEDLDGHVEWETGHAEPLDVFEELAPRLMSEEEVARHFEHKFLDHKVGRPDKTELVFIPVWQARWQSYRTETSKTLYIDGIRGQVFDF